MEHPYGVSVSRTFTAAFFLSVIRIPTILMISFSVMIVAFCIPFFSVFKGLR